MQGESQTSSEMDLKDEPIKYSTSDAAKWKTAYSTSGELYFKFPRIQPPVVAFSLAAFLIYFCILREENDLDDWMRELESTVPIQVEMLQLRAEIDMGKKNGTDVSWKEARLEKLIEKREAAILANKQS